VKIKPELNPQKHTRMKPNCIDILLFSCRILSALAHWSPIFGETQYLPVMAFPFVKLFQNNHLVAFEIIACVLGKYLCTRF